MNPLLEQRVRGFEKYNYLYYTAKPLQIQGVITMNEIEHTILTGYPAYSYIDHERKSADMTPLDEQVYDDANILFKTLEEEINND